MVAKSDMVDVQLTELDDLSSQSSLNSLPTTPNPAVFFPRPLPKTRSWGLILSRFGTATGMGRGSMQDELEAALAERAWARQSAALEKLRHAVTGSREELTGLPQDAWSWFVKYLDARMAPLWEDLIVPMLPEQQDEQHAETATKTAIYLVLAEVAGQLLGAGEVTLPGIVRHLREIPVKVEGKGETESLSLLRDGSSDELAIHLVFQAIGWLTGIWEPLPDITSRSLRIAQDRAPRRRTGVLYDPVIRHTEAIIPHLQYQSIYLVAGRFGKLFPTPDLRSLGSRDLESACVTTAYLSFHSLEDIVNVRLVWTATLAQHLEYDQRQKKLYVFKHPSMCFLLCREQPQTLLSDMFQQGQRANSGSTDTFPLDDQVEFEGYLVEVLLSYRLVFARDRRSRKSIRRHIEELGEDCDPLLKILCTEKDDAEDVKSIHRHLDTEPAENYVPIAEFPFLAKKFSQLQKASMGRNPHSIRRLWFDRRNPPAWFALWAVLIITGATLLIQLIQMIFQIMQGV